MAETKRVLMRLAFIGLFLWLIVGCAGADESGVAAPEIKGPALVMFYTDN